MDNYSLSDLSAVTGGGFGGSAWIIILFVLIFGMNGWNRNGDFGNYATAASQQEILFGQQFQNLDNKMDRLGNGIADATFALNNSIKDGNYATQTAIKDCCCTTQRNTDSLRFDMANYNAGILAAIGADGEKTRALIQQNKIEALQQKVQSLELSQAMCGVVRYPQAWTYNAGASPFCNNGCGCNNAV